MYGPRPQREALKHSEEQQFDGQDVAQIAAGSSFASLAPSRAAAAPIAPASGGSRSQVRRQAAHDLPRHLRPERGGPADLLAAGEGYER